MQLPGVLWELIIRSLKRERVEGEGERERERERRCQREPKRQKPCVFTGTSVCAAGVVVTPVCTCM